MEIIPGENSSIGWALTKTMSELGIGLGMSEITDVSMDQTVTFAFQNLE